MELKQALKHIAFYVSMAAIFNGALYFLKGITAGSQFTMAYIIEIMLSMDNLFVFALIFSYMKVSKGQQYRTLYWGILGAVVLRMLFIVTGIQAVQATSWSMYLFGGFLIYTGFKMVGTEDEANNIGDNKVLKFCNKYLHVTGLDDSNRFWVRKDYFGQAQIFPDAGKTRLWFTPLFITLILIEISDVMFAFDSIPAAFAITLDPFIILSANIFAILGLRSMYFVLAAMLERFAYLKYGLSLILVGIGTKMVMQKYTGLESISTVQSLLATLGILGISVIYSLYKTKESQ